MSTTMILSCILPTIPSIRFTAPIIPPGIMAMDTITVIPTIILHGDLDTTMVPGDMPA